jgi:hypothetical protein
MTEIESFTDKTPTKTPGWTVDTTGCAVGCDAESTDTELAVDVDVGGGLAELELDDRSDVTCDSNMQNSGVWHSNGCN